MSMFVALAALAAALAAAPDSAVVGHWQNRCDTAGCALLTIDNSGGANITYTLLPAGGGPVLTSGRLFNVDPLTRPVLTASNGSTPGVGPFQRLSIASQGATVAMATYYSDADAFVFARRQGGTAHGPGLTAAWPSFAQPLPAAGRQPDWGAMSWRDASMVGG